MSCVGTSPKHNILQNHFVIHPHQPLPPSGVAAFQVHRYRKRITIQDQSSSQ
jgi:hypothetical protein